MIAYLSGTVHQKLEQRIILLNSGVGYLVGVTAELFSQLQQGADCCLFIHTQVKEDDICLYGFLSLEELKFFQLLIGVSGIGCKTALGILNMPLDLAQSAIQNEDLAYLCRVPGLGKKTAARLSLELKGKLEVRFPPGSRSASAPHSLQEEAMAALLSLGYDKPTIIRFLNETGTEAETAEDLVREFLQSA
ncbi:MAG: Holliday junction branch migration protein RuvA [bacterium]|nr:Holliday junction branch migration protein RuvA [bacterium]